MVATIFGTAGLPHILVRFYTNRDGHAARRTTLVVLAMIGVFYLFPPILGLIGRVRAPDLYASNRTDALLLELPDRLADGRSSEVLRALTAAGAFAAFGSTSSGLLVAVAGTLAHDLYTKTLRLSAGQRERLRAVDYLLKPVDPARLRETLTRVNASQPHGAAGETPQSTSPTRGVWLDKLPIEADGRTLLVDLHELRYVEARGDIVYVRLYDRTLPTRFTVNELERRLPTPPFIRNHRAFIANMRNVVEISPAFNGAYIVKVNDAHATELIVSRGRVKDLRTLLGL